MPLLKVRRKWQDDHVNLKNGDLILLNDKDISRNQWPVGVIVNTIDSADGLVRKAEVCVIVSGKRTVYTRRISEIILLVA